MIKSLERERAATAVRGIRDHLKTHPTKKEFWDAYAKAANGLPMAIRQQGFARAMQMELTLAVKAKDEKKAGRLAVLTDICTGIITWEDAAGKPAGFAVLVTAINAANAENKATVLIEQAITLDFWSYTVLQRETLEILAWLKMLCKPHEPPKDAPVPAVNPAAGGPAS
jgi:hypothetical protein